MNTSGSGIHEAAAGFSCGDPAVTFRAAAMFWVSALFLVLIAWLVSLPEDGVEPLVKVPYVLATVAALWVLLVIESAVLFYRRPGRSWRDLTPLLLVLALPAFRMGVASDAAGRCLWLPWLGWRAKDIDLFLLLDRMFSIPMVFIALLILPLLALEFFWQEQISTSRLLTVVLHAGTAVIWFAFALELVLLSSVADNKIVFFLRHWINVLVVVLPVVAFLRSFQALRAVRAVRVLRVGKVLRVFRMRGLLIRAWRALVVLDVVERFVHRDSLKRLDHLRELLAEKEREAEHIRQRIQQLEQELVDRDGELDSVDE